ncbi:hypothetical protein PS918_03146 [Pseudomonas fluorescens]|uniref:DUF4214 domain-containing protein n=1 Tax=Pseudomonas fluorescens TaxID=294 RepID=A0A5E7SWQ5_PSEFL|nr:DUF4214 domain-containing protein [Pseudomonas fluorescens]VVP90067.1 hypothetical protein PS918_03146 [Pseudomonas fluorescens]
MTEVESQKLATVMYVAAFGRAPDKDGLAYWSGQLTNGLSFDGLVSSFLNSNEGKSLYGDDVSDAAFFTNFYSTVLNRSPDSAGAAYWQDRFSDLGNRKDLIKEMIFSIQDGKGEAHQLLQNKVDAGLSFAKSLSGNDLTYAKSLLSFVTSDTSSVATANLINNYWDYPPSPVTPPVSKNLDLMGKNLEADFGFASSSIEHKAFAVGNGVELTGFGVMNIDVYAGGFVLTSDGFDVIYGDGVQVTFTDVNNELAAFKGVIINSSTFTDHAPYKTLGKTNITVSDDVVTIDLSGVYLSQGESIDFSITG